jgi:hypothetical protein
MKSFIALALAGVLVAATPVQAQHRHHGHHHGHHRGPVIVHHDRGNWVLPLMGGVIVGAIVADQAAKKEQEQKSVVIVPQQSVVIAPAVNCTAWKEIQTSDGTIYRERYCTEGR